MFFLQHPESRYFAAFSHAIYIAFRAGPATLPFGFLLVRELPVTRGTIL
jgi:hypothetical protein